MILIVCLLGVLNDLYLSNNHIISCAVMVNIEFELFWPSFIMLALTILLHTIGKYYKSWIYWKFIQLFFNVFCKQACLSWTDVRRVNLSSSIILKKLQELYPANENIISGKCLKCFSVIFIQRVKLNTFERRLINNRFFSLSLTCQY